MRATFMYGAGDVRVIDVPDPVIQQPTDAIVRVVRACICGSDLHPYHSMPVTPGGSSMGHEFIGVVEDAGDDVTSVKKGDLVIAPLPIYDIGKFGRISRRLRTALDPHATRHSA